MSLPENYKNNIYFDVQADRYLYRHHNVLITIAHYIAKSDLPSPPHAKAPYASFSANQVMIPLVIQNEQYYRQSKKSTKLFPCIPLVDCSESVRTSMENDIEKYRTSVEDKIKKAIENSEKRFWFKST
jgi:hypothetical protein